jgi:hypothetical protein
MIGACNALGMTLFFFGDFGTAQQYLGQGLELWRSAGAPSVVEEVDVRAVSCLCYKAECDWHLGEVASSHATISEAIRLAKRLNDTHGLTEALAEALASAASLGHSERNAAEVDRWASELVELATRHRFATWRAVGFIFGGWARSASGDTAAGLTWIEDGLRQWRTTGFSPFFRTRALGVTRANGRRGTASHGGRSALHSYAGGPLSDCHPRTRRI